MSIYIYILYIHIIIICIYIYIYIYTHSYIQYIYVYSCIFYVVVLGTSKQKSVPEMTTCRATGRIGLPSPGPALHRRLGSEPWCPLKPTPASWATAIGRTYWVLNMDIYSGKFPNWMVVLIGTSWKITCTWTYCPFGLSCLICNNIQKRNLSYITGYWSKGSNKNKNNDNKNNKQNKQVWIHVIYNLNVWWMNLDRPNDPKFRVPCALSLLQQWSSEASIVTVQQNRTILRSLCGADSVTIARLQIIWSCCKYSRSAIQSRCVSLRTLMWV